MLGPIDIKIYSTLRPVPLLRPLDIKTT